MLPALIWTRRTNAWGRADRWCKPPCALQTTMHRRRWQSRCDEDNLKRRSEEWQGSKRWRFEHNKIESWRNASHSGERPQEIQFGGVGLANCQPMSSHLYTHVVRKAHSLHGLCWREGPPVDALERQCVGGVGRTLKSPHHCWGLGCIQQHGNGNQAVKASPQQWWGHVYGIPTPFMNAPKLASHLGLYVGPDSLYDWR